MVMTGGTLHAGNLSREEVVRPALLLPLALLLACFLARQLLVRASARSAAIVFLI